MSVLLKINNLSGGYYKEDIIRELSMDVNQGDFLVVIGPNGSGKTTLLRLVTRALPLRKGEVFYKNENIAQMNLKEFCRKVAFVSQDISTGFSFTVMELVLMGRIPHLKRLQYETKRDIEIAKEKLELTDTFSLKDKRIDELSAGERQRVVIARALAQEPELLFLDEPTIGLDPQTRNHMWSYIADINKKEDMTVFFTTHYMEEADRIAQRIAIIDHGKIIAEGSSDELK